MSAGLNLMPLSARRRRVRRDATRLWIAVLIVVLAACVAVAAREVLAGTAARQQLEALESQHAPITLLERDSRVLRAKIEALENTEGLALALSRQRPLVTLLGVLSQASAAAGGDLFINSLAYTFEEDGGEKITVLLRGAANNTLAATRLVDELRASGLFTGVRLESTAALDLPQQAATSFTVECVIQ